MPISRAGAMMGDGGDANGSERGRRRVGVSSTFASSLNTRRGNSEGCLLEFWTFPSGLLQTLLQGKEKTWLGRSLVLSLVAPAVVSFPSSWLPLNPGPAKVTCRWGHGAITNPPFREVFTEQSQCYKWGSRVSSHQANQLCSFALITVSWLQGRMSLECSYLAWSWDLNS